MPLAATPIQNFASWMGPHPRFTNTPISVGLVTAVQYPEQEDGHSCLAHKPAVLRHAHRPETPIGPIYLFG